MAATHSFRAVEFPELAAGFETHPQKCANCAQCPIVGTCFQCAECKGLALCQACYFSETRLAVDTRRHSPEHAFELHLKPSDESKTSHRCSWCEGTFPSVYK